MFICILFQHPFFLELRIVLSQGGVNMQEVVTVLHDGKAPPETLATLLQVTKLVAGEIREFGSG